MTTDNQTLAQPNAEGVSVADRINAKFGLPTGEPEVTAESGEESTQVVDDGLDDLDWEGQKLKVPKGLKEAVLRQEDYTRKTQDLAEHRRSLDQIRELAQTKQIEAAFSESISAEQQEIHVIDAYLAQVGKLDWSQMPTDQMLRQKIEIDNIQSRRQQLASAVNEKRTKFTGEMQAKISELRGKSREMASKSIPGFSEETEKAVREFAKAEGLADPEIDNVLLDPRSYRVLWKAMQFDQVKAGTGKAAEAAKKADRVLRPGAAGERMPAKTAEQLNFNKAMKAAGNNSSAKARVIEDRLTGLFSKGQSQ